MRKHISLPREYKVCSKKTDPLSLLIEYPRCSYFDVCFIHHGCNASLKRKTKEDNSTLLMRLVTIKPDLFPPTVWSFGRMNEYTWNCVCYRTDIGCMERVYTASHFVTITIIHSDSLGTKWMDSVRNHSGKYRHLTYRINTGSDVIY